MIISKIVGIDCIVETTPNKERLAVFYKTDNGLLHNLIGKDNKPLCDCWFDAMDDFHNGFAIVSKNGKYNYIDYNGKLLLQESVYFAYPFKNGVAIIRKSQDEYNIIDKNGKYLLDEDLNEISDCGFLCARKGNLWNIIDINGNFVFDEWYSRIEEIEDARNYLVITKDEKQNIIDINSKEFVSKEWFDNIDTLSYYYGWIRVSLNNKTNYFSVETKNFISDEWFDGCKYFKNCLCLVKTNGVQKMIDTNGNVCFTF